MRHPVLARLLVQILLAAPVLAQDDPAPASETTRPAVASAEDVCRDLIGSLQSGDATALWSFLPPAWQRDINGLVHDLGHRLDPKLYERGTKAVVRAIALLGDKREFVLGSAHLGGLFAGDEHVYDAMAGMLGILAHSDLATHQGLLDFDGAKFMAAAGRDLLLQAMALSEAEGMGGATELASLTVKTARVLPQKTVLMFQSRDMPPSTEEYVLMEQHWVPAKLARQWPRNLQAMQQSLAQLPALKDKRAQAQLLSVLVAVDKALDRLNAATSQEQFDAAIVDLLATAKTALAPAKPKSK
jgi:hypothetical protein